MLSIVGIIFGLACIFGSFIVGGGSMAPIWHALPLEGTAILGSAIGGLITANSMTIVKGTLAGLGKILKGPALALESHVEAPESSPIFGEYPRLLHDHALIHLITDSIRLIVVSSSAPRPDSVEDIMNASIKTHHHDALKPAETLATMAGALPALGIVACVLGVVKTMGSIDQPPAVLGARIGAALVGTFLGVLLAYGFMEPLSVRLKQIVDEEGQIYHVAKQIIVGTLNGHPMPVIIEAARVSISHENQPSFSEVFDGLRGK